ncbi:hypothetical protein Tco_1027361 [Tanacetum coccineum]
MVFNSPCLTDKKELIHHEGCYNKEWLVQEGTALGKDYIKSVNGCDDLPKIIRLASPRVNGYLVKASSNPFLFFDSPLPGVNTPWDVMRIECGASESADVYVSSLHSQHHAHMCFCCFLMLVKCFAAVPISIPSGRTFIVPAGSILQTLKGSKICLGLDQQEGQLIGSELVQETFEKISQIKDRLKVAHDHQKSYVNKRRKPLKFSVGNYVLLKVSPWKGVVRFGKKGKLAPRFVGPFEIIEKVGPVAYRLDLPEELDGVHDTFHVLNLKECLVDPTLQLPLDEIRVDDRLNFMEERVEILEREFKKLKQSRIEIVKVQWNSKCGPEFTWEREDQMKLKYSHLFSANSSWISGAKFFLRG